MPERPNSKIPNESKMSPDGAINAASPNGDWRQFPWGGFIREISVTAISAAIAIITLYMLLLCFWHGGNVLPDDGVKAFSRQKDVLALALGLFGTVTGYYFGRIPAEKAADAAKSSEQNAKKVATESLDKLERQISGVPKDADLGGHTQSLLSQIAIAKATLR
jgi:hypothetical protein